MAESAEQRAHGDKRRPPCRLSQIPHENPNIVARTPTDGRLFEHSGDIIVSPTRSAFFQGRARSRVESYAVLMKIENSEHRPKLLKVIVGDILAMPSVFDDDLRVACDRISLRNAKIQVVVFGAPQCFVVSINRQQTVASI
jgi:hypothetical protein